jgi:DnaK suppressor protein
MTATELQKYRKALELQSAELARSLRQRQRIAVETAADMMDATVLAAERELAVQALEKEHRRMHEMQAALARAGNGTYGVCIRCEEPISPRRLEAIPWAAFCRDCQEHVDRLHAGVGALRARVA